MSHPRTIALVFLFVAASAQAGSRKLNLSVSAVNPSPVKQSSANAAVDCDTLMTCAFVRSMGPMCAPEGERPAVFFNNLSDVTIHIEADFYGDTTDCSGDFQTVVGDIPEMAGPGGILLNFVEPPPQDFMYSIVWRINNCPQTLCQFHQNGSFPEFCPRVRL